jgi:hypothetical protein
MKLKVCQNVRVYTYIVVLVLTISNATLSVNSQKQKSSGAISDKKLPVQIDCSLDAQNKLQIYLDKAKYYEDRLIRGKSIVDLNSLLWKCNESARQTFQAFWQTLISETEVAKAKKKNVATNSQDEIKALNYTINTNVFLKQYLISRLKSLDNSLANQLSKSFTPQEKGFAEFLSFDNINPNSLSEQQINSMKQFVKTNPVSETVPFLFGLRKQNDKVADQLYLELLSVSQANISFTFDELGKLGTYLYTSSNSSISEDSYSFGYLPARGILIVDLTKERSKSNKSLRISYLSLASRFLLNPVTVIWERTQRYVFGRIMLAHIYADSPELSTLFLRALQVHFDGVPEIYKEESFYEAFRKVHSISDSVSFEKNIKDIEKTIGSDERDDKAVRLAASLYREEQYDKIWKVIEFISDIDKKDNVLNISKYSQVIKLIESKENYKAKLVASEINQPTLKAIVGIRLIQSLEKSKKNSSGLLIQDIYEVVENAKKSNDAFGPVILLSIAKLIDKNEEGLQYDLISSAVKKLNDAETWNPPLWYVEITTPTLSIQKVRFSMKKLDSLNVDDSLRFLISESKLKLEELLLNIKNEKIHSTAMLLFAKRTLEEDMKELLKIKKGSNK